MTLLAIAFLVGIATGTGLAKHPRTRGLFLAEKPVTVPMLTENGTSVEDWKKVFRETVIAVDGGLTKEMNEFLVSDKVAKAKEQALAKQLLAEAREQAKKELDELLDGDESVEKKRLLDGSNEEFRADFNASANWQEKLDVVRRWHANGFMCTPKLRSFLLEKVCPNQSFRDAYREMFDEQDE